MRKAREEGFSLAMSDMTTNLENELEIFKDRIKSDKSVTVTHRDGYGGGGSFGFVSILLLIGFVFINSFLFYRAKQRM
jgi:rhombotail lipoprotein